MDGERAAVIDCDDVTNWLAGSRRPSPDQARALAAHLATCDACRELVEADAAPFRWLSRISLAALDDPARLGLPVVDPIVFGVAVPLARGGMGQISRARDRRLDREVALKEVLDPGLQERFEREVEITARLQHPAIIPIYEAGKWPDGSAFYTMRLVDGGTLHDAIARTAALEARLALLPHVRAVSEALAYAHAQRVIHRDLKPGNVLVGKFGETVVIDWGLAKQLSSAPEVDARIASRSVGPVMAPHDRALATAETMVDPPTGASPPVGAELLTRAGSVLGTPGFMSPEQAAGEEVDERADVYALGGILYNLLAGHPPYFDLDLDLDGPTAALLRQPTPIAERAPGAPADLRAIVERAMARPASARYPTAQQFVDDLRRFEAGQLLRTREYGLRELVARWLRRHRTAVIAGSIAVIAVIAIGIAALIGIARSEARERDARQVAEQARAAAEADTASLLEEQGRTALLSGDRDRALAYLAAAFRHGRDTLALRHLAADADRDLELTAGEFATRGASIGSFGWMGERAVAIQRGETAAMTVWVRLHEAATSPIPGGALRSWLSQDTRRAAVLTHDHRLAIYDTEAGRQLWALDRLDTTNADIDVVFSPAGDRVVVMNHVGQVTPAQLFDVATGARIALPAAITRGARPDLDPVAGAFSRDGKLLAIGRLDNTVIVWAIGAPAPLRTWSPYRPWQMAFARGYAATADDRLVITTGERPMILPLDGSPPIPIASRTAGLPELAVSPDGHQIALGDDAGGVVQLWTSLAQWLGEAHDLRGEISALRFSPDGSLLLGGGDDKRAAVWETPSLTLRGMVVASRDEATAGDDQPRITALVWSSDGLRFATVGWNEPRAQRWRTPASNRIARFPSRGSALAPAGDRLVTQSEGKLTIRDVVTGAVRAEWVSQPDVDINDNAWLTSDGRRAVVAGDHTTSLFDLTSGPGKLDEIALPAGRSPIAMLSADGRWVVEGGDAGVRVLDAATGRVIRTLAVTDCGGGAFSPDGERLVLAFGDRPARMWRTSTGEELALHGVDHASDARFDRTGRRLVLYGGERAVMVDPATGAPLATFGVAGGPRIDAVEFDDAGRRLVTHGSDRAARLWDVDRRTLTMSVEASLAASISHDGRRLVTSHSDGTLQIWDVASGRVLQIIHDQQSDFELMWSRDDSRLITTSSRDHMAAIWDVHLADPAQVATRAEASHWQLVDGQLVPRSLPPAR